MMMETTVSDLTKTHFLVTGRTRSGKSKWFEFVTPKLLDKGWGFAAIDRKGSTADALADYMAYRMPDRKVIVIDCTRDDWIIPLNLFLSADEDRSIEAVLKVFGSESSNDSPRMAKWMVPTFYLFSSGVYTFNEVIPLLAWDNRALREAALQHITDPIALSIWHDLLSFSRYQEYDAQLGSTINRMMRFAAKKQLRRVMGLPQCNLNFDEIVEQGTVLIVKLQETDGFSVQNGLLVGTVIINSLLHAVMKRKKQLENPYFLLIDEASDFISPDVQETE